MIHSVLATRFRVVLVFAFCTRSLCAGESPVAGDVVLLRDGSRHVGKLVELGGNSVSLELRGGSRKIVRRDIEGVRFDEDREEATVVDIDVVVRKGGHEIRGDVELVQRGRVVRVTLPGGSMAEIPRSDVVRIIRRGETIVENPTVYTRSLGRRIDLAIARVCDAKDESGEGPEEMTPSDAEAFLERSGIFAIQKVRAALKAPGLSEDAVAALTRIGRLYQLKEVMATEIEEAEPNVYRILSEDSTQEKRTLLLLVFPRFVDESVPLAKFLALDSLQEPIVRAWSVDFLRRMHKNHDLLEIYSDGTGQTQLAAAIALGRNRILLGVPALLDAMELDLEDVRRVADRHLRQFSGQDFGFRADAAPQARREALARWRHWWQENESAIGELATKLLRDVPVDAQDHQQVIDEWKAASRDIQEGKYAAAEARLRRVRTMDPTFQKGAIGLAILLYAYLDRPQEAAKILTEVRGLRSPDSPTKEREWVYLHLGHSLRLCGTYEEALDAYRNASILNPDSIESTLGVADTSFRLGTGDSELSTESRKKALQVALSAYESAIRIIDNRTEDMSVVSIGDLPIEIDLPFDRREYNRSIIELRTEYRLRRHGAAFQAAKIRVLLGDTMEGLKVLQTAIDDIGLDSGEKADAIQVEMRTYMGLLYEQLDRPLLAFREYRHVLDKLDPKNDFAAQGIERLRQQVRRDSANDKR